MQFKIFNRKKSAGVLCAITLCIILYSCGDHKNAAPAPQGMQTLDLKNYGKSFSIFVPDTTKARLTITEQSTGALEIRSGSNFAIAINEQTADLDLIKSDLKGDEVNKLKTMMVDEPEAIMWESAVVQSEYHFCVNKKIANSEYSFEDIRSTEAEPFTKDAVQRMFDACKSVQPIEK